VEFLGKMSVSLVEMDLSTVFVSLLVLLEVCAVHWVNMAALAGYCNNMVDFEEIAPWLM